MQRFSAQSERIVTLKSDCYDIFEFYTFTSGLKRFGRESFWTDLGCDQPCFVFFGGSKWFGFPSSLSLLSELQTLPLDGQSDSSWLEFSPPISVEKHRRICRWLFPSLFVTSTCERLIPSSGQWTHAAMKTWWDLFSTGPSLGKEFLQRVTGGLGWRPGNALMPKLDGWWLQTFFNFPSPTYKLFEFSKMIFDKMWLYNNQTKQKTNSTKKVERNLNEQYLMNKTNLGTSDLKKSISWPSFVGRSFLGQHLDLIRSLESWSYVPHSFCRSFWKVVPWKRTGKEWRCFRDFP